jgi:hypothetical protein
MHHFLVIFEDGIIRRDTIFYALQLASRMEGSLYILMLSDESEPEVQAKAQEALAEMLEGISFGNRVSWEIRSGDKASELLKYLALAPPFHTVVWGGEDKVLKESRYGKKRHWFAEAAKKISCPIVTPVSKERS